MIKEYISKYRIYYEDTDAGSVVYYANYLKFYERARTEMLRQNNIYQTNLIQDYDIAFVVSECQIKYKKPARLDDFITVKTTIKNINPFSLDIGQETYIGDIFLNKLDVTIACVSYTNMKLKKIPNFLTKLLNS